MKHTQTGSRRPTKGGGLPRASAIDQEELFNVKPGAGDVGPVARAADPMTSHHATKKAAHELTTKQLAVLDLLQRVRGAPTHEEIIRDYRERRLRHTMHGAGFWYPDLTDSSIRTRTKELVALGFVQKQDENGTSDRGNPATRWTLTAAGALVDVARLRR